MTTELTIHQLQVKSDSPERAREYARLGYMQWLSSLPHDSCYQSEAMKAYMAAVPLMRTDPSVALFCELIRQSLTNPLAPLDLALPKPKRRGGARKRRAMF
jgi:hypothetical protein